MKALSKAQASRCEHAKTHRCRCRCQGALHGAGRGPVESLPVGDPHAVKAVKAPDKELGALDRVMVVGAPGWVQPELPGMPAHRYGWEDWA